MNIKSISAILKYFTKSVLISCMFILQSNCPKKINGGPNPGNIYKYSGKEIKQQKVEKKWLWKYWNNHSKNPYHEYLVSTWNKLRTSASVTSINEFANLFDNRIAPRYWYTFNDLSNSLEHTRLSELVTTKINWNQLYEQSNHQAQSLASYHYFLLRLYNIIAKLYSRPTTLHLVQNTSVDLSATLVAHTDYYVGLSAIKMRFDKDFINQLAINEEYRRRNLSSKMPVVIIAREYARALLYYVANNESQREKFNTYPITEPKIMYSNFQTKPQISSSVKSNQIFQDVTQSLINYLANRSNINMGNDELKKLLLSFLVVDSKASRKAWRLNNVNFRDELFIEAFARWIGTDSEKRNFAWEMLNDYFMYHFRRIYQL